MYSPLTSQTAKNPPLPGHRLAAGLEIGGVMTASRLERPAALTVSCGIAELDTLTGGLPRGALTEICGLPSSGRSSLMLAADRALLNAKQAGKNRIAPAPSSKATAER